MTKEEILRSADQVFSDFTAHCLQLSEKSFFEKNSEKWSIAENMQHLILSTRMTNLAYRLPLLMVWLMAGKPKRASQTFEELQQKYFKKLEQGARASAPFVPKPIAIKATKEKLMARWTNISSAFTRSLGQNRTEKQLDSYQVKHPLLGKITLRELCYFTIFHTQHHLNTIQKTVIS